MEKTIYTADELMAFEDKRPLDVQFEEEYRRGYVDGFRSYAFNWADATAKDYEELQRMLFEWQLGDLTDRFELPPV